MRQLINDLTGRRFGRLVVIGRDDRNSRKTYYNCLCDCGNMKSVRSDSLIAGTIRSCGCLKKEQDRENLTAAHTHKMSGTRIYQIWQGIKKRCYNPHDVRYERYGRRGIKVCDEWRDNFQSFYDWAMENGYDDSLTIDRIDNDGDYRPENCRWSSSEEQARNRSSNIKITIGNVTKTLVEWCQVFDVDYHVISARYSRNGFIGIDELFN